MSPGCAARWTAEGVEIRAIALPALTAVAGVAATSQNLRNLTAHWCFGTEQLVNLPVYPFSFDPAYSGFDRLDPADLTDLDVPLAVFRWTGQSVVDLDNWSARRRITTPDPVPSEWSAAVADRRDADGQARFLQFQDQIDQIAAGGTADRTMAANTFGFLPPVGFLPVRYQGGEITSTTASDPASDPASAKALALAKTAAAAGPASEFDPWFFFNGLAWFGGTINWSVADFALRQSWQLPPVPTTFNSEGRPPLTWYWIRENVNSPTAPWYLVFMTDLPWQGNNDSTFTATGPPKGEVT
jgi:hypothetical protein